VRTITIPAAQQHRIPDFVAAVDREFRKDIKEAFSRHTDPDFDPRRIARERAKNNYSNKRVVKALDHAISIARNHGGFGDFPPPLPGPQAHGSNGWTDRAGHETDAQHRH
jgi:hypothetical protein